ncbi:MAG TPA: DinB family protein [Candidatus Limnocylindria bacterium]|nr:DinB family protein [Candidatus Limnocylindria bacterium]
MRIALSREEILALLEETPERIATATAGMTAARARTAPKAGEWSLNDILAHLRACADIGGDAIARILAEDRPTLRAVDPRVHVTETDYLRVDFESSLRAFARQRARSLAVLQRLAPTDWSRGARVIGRSRTREESVLSYAHWLARHERAHYPEIERLARRVSGK